MVLFLPFAVKLAVGQATWSTAVLAFVAVLVLCYYFMPDAKSGQAPGPRPWPVLGSLHLVSILRISVSAEKSCDKFKSFKESFENVRQKII
jgi:O-antigen/teichoic acid export membrane protein